MEHICLVSGIEEERKAESRTAVNREITQRSTINGCQAHFRIFNDRYLGIWTERFGSGTKGYSFDIRYLNPKPRRQLHISWGWLGLAAALLCIAVMLGITINQAPPPAVSHPALPFALGAGGAGMIALAVAMYRSGLRLAWFSLHGRIRLVELMIDQPSRADVQAFASDLKDRIMRAHNAQKVDPALWLSAELREHRRLKEEGILTEAIYAKAKERILRCHQ